MSVLTTVGKLLPPPLYLRLPAAGVDISDSSLKYVQFLPDRRSGTALRLATWGDIDIPDGVLQRGTVTDVKALSNILAEARQRIGMNTMRISLPEERAYLFETEVKRDTPFNQIHGLLEFRLEENVPLSPRDAYFDYDIIEDRVQTDMLRVSVTAYARETIQNYYEACRGAGIMPLSFEIEAAAIARASIPYGDNGTHMIVDFGQTRTGIGIVYRGALVYTSTIDIGGKELSIALRHQLGDQEEAKLTELKNTQGLVRGVEGSAVYDALLPTLSAIVDEVRTRIDYWDSRGEGTPDRKLQSIILCGGSVNLRGLPEYFTEMFGLPATRADVWQNAFANRRQVPAIDRRHAYGYATAIGLALTPYL